MSLKSSAQAAIAALKRTNLWRLIQRLGEDQVGLFAAAIAYNALFSMFPIFLAVLAIVGFVLRDPATLARARSLILGTLPPESTGAVIEVLDGTAQSAGLLGLVSLIGLLWGGSGLFGALEIALDRIYRVPPRSVVGQKLMGVGMVFLFTFLVLVILAGSSVAQFVASLADSVPVVGAGAATAIGFAGGAVSLLAAFALAFAIYFFVPSKRLSARQTLPGALFAGLALVLLTLVFPIYASLIGSFNQFGAIFGLFFLLMTWCYLVADALLLGAEINAVLAPVSTRLGEEPGRAPEPERQRPAA